MSKNKKYYKKNYYHKNNNKKTKVTYDSLMRAKTINIGKQESNFSTISNLRIIAISIIIFFIIIGSVILFRQV